MMTSVRCSSGTSTATPTWSRAARSKVSQASADYVRPMWASIGSMVIGRHLFDMTNGWEGTPPAGEHVVVVSHRPKPDGWHPEASYHFVDDVAAAIAKAKELAGERTVAVAAGDVGGQALALGLVDEVAMDVVPVVFGSGKRYFGSVDGQHLLEDPDVVIRGRPGAAPALPGSPLRNSVEGLIVALDLSPHICRRLPRTFLVVAVTSPDGNGIAGHSNC